MNTFKIGDRVICVDSRCSGGLQLGNVYEIQECCGSDWVTVKGVQYSVLRFKLYEEKQMKREDKISLEITLQEAAQIYAVIGTTNGSVGYKVYKTLKETIDPERIAYNKFVEHKLGLVNYSNIQKEFEAEIFDKKSPAQIELEALQQKIKDLTEQASKLEAVINK